jgi:ATP/maltotriose-dependent transcriptional regulator MalT
LLQQGLALRREAGKPREIHIALNAMTTLAFYRGDYARARAYLEEGLSMAREAGEVRAVAIYATNLGQSAILTGEYERAEALSQEAREQFSRLGDRNGLAEIERHFAFLALTQNHLDRAEKHCVKVILDLQERAEVVGIDTALEILASVAAARGENGRAARIWGGVAGYREASGVPWIPDERAMIEPHIEAARARLEEAVWQEEREKGRSMSLDQTMGYALENKELA